MSPKKESRKTHVALLRGINVGGKNVIKMVDLRACFEDGGFHDVATYIQSGNVIFTAPRTKRAELTTQIEEMLGTAFDYEASVVLRSLAQMRTVVGGAPDGFGTRPKEHRYDVAFLKTPLAAKTAIKAVRTRPGVDEVHAGTNVLYLSRLISRASQSYFSKLASLPIYQRMTVRNWNTTTKLLQRMEGLE